MDVRKVDPEEFIKLLSEDAAQHINAQAAEIARLQAEKQEQVEFAGKLKEQIGALKAVMVEVAESMDRIAPQWHRNEQVFCSLRAKLREAAK